MPGICPNPLQCVAIHEIRSEIAQVNSRLAMEMTQIHSKLISLTATMQAILQCSQNNTMLSTDLTSLPPNPSVSQTNFVEQIPNDNLEWSTNDNNIQSPITIKQECIPNSTDDISQIITSTEIHEANVRDFTIPDVGPPYMVGSMVSQEVTETPISLSQELQNGNSLFSMASPIRYPSTSTAKTKRGRKKRTSYIQRLATNPVFRKTSVKSLLNKPTSSFPSVQRRFCKVCDKIISFNWRAHVASIHLKNPCLCCNLCDYKAKWSISVIKEHFSKVHRGVPLNITDKKHELMNEIDKIGNEIIDLADK